MTRLEKNAKLIVLLHPKLRAEATAIAAELETKLTGRARFRVISTYRSASEQNALYAQGRTKPGAIVTQAKAYQSNHNFGTSLDFALDIDSDGNGTFETAKWDTNKDFDSDGVADWMEVIAVFKAHGWSSGADWRTFKDYPQ